MRETEPEFSQPVFFTAEGGMNALQKVVEGKLTADRNDDFAIKDEGFFAQGQCGSNRPTKSRCTSLVSLPGPSCSTPRQLTTTPMA